MVVDQLRSIFQNPEVVARTFREVATLAKDGPSADELARLDERRTRRKQVGQAIRSLLRLDDLRLRDAGFSFNAYWCFDENSLLARFNKVSVFQG